MHYFIDYIHALFYVLLSVNNLLCYYIFYLYNIIIYMHYFMFYLQLSFTINKLFDEENK